MWKAESWNTSVISWEANTNLSKRVSSKGPCPVTGREEGQEQGIDSVTSWMGLKLEEPIWKVVKRSSGRTAIHGSRMAKGEARQTGKSARFANSPIVCWTYFICPPLCTAASTQCWKQNQNVKTKTEAKKPKTREQDQFRRKTNGLRPETGRITDSWVGRVGDDQIPSTWLVLGLRVLAERKPVATKFTPMSQCYPVSQIFMLYTQHMTIAVVYHTKVQILFFFLCYRKKCQSVILNITKDHFMWIALIHKGEPSWYMTDHLYQLSLPSLHAR